MSKNQPMNLTLEQMREIVANADNVTVARTQLAELEEQLASGEVANWAALVPFLADIGQALTNYRGATPATTPRARRTRKSTPPAETAPLPSEPEPPKPPIETTPPPPVTSTPEARGLIFTVNGVTASLAQHCEKYGKDYGKTYQRAVAMTVPWTIEEALELVPRRTKARYKPPFYASRSSRA